MLNTKLTERQLQMLREIADNLPVRRKTASAVALGTCIEFTFRAMKLSNEKIDAVMAATSTTTPKGIMGADDEAE